MPVKLKTVQGACPHDCPDTCGILWGVEGERLIKVQGDPAHPPTEGVLCTKVSRYIERVEHPDRLLQPMRRVGRKGEGRFEPISWDAALDLAAERLSAIAARNPEAILPYSYAGTMGLVQSEGMAARFWHRLGASRLDRTICSAAGGAGLRAVYGAPVGMHVQDFAASRLIVIWGSHSITSNLHFWRIAQQARRDGARLVCIDPRRTETADKCDQHVALMPGSDGALALGIMRVWFDHNLLDTAWIAAHLEGFMALQQRVAGWSVDRAAAACGLEPAVIRQLAFDMAAARPCAIRLNYGMQRVRGGGTAVRLIALLPCLIGAWRQRGGGLLLSSSGWFLPWKDMAALERPDLLAGRDPRTINMSAIGDALLHPGGEGFGPRIEALVVYDSNPVAVAPDGSKVAAGFRRDDLFTIVLEHFRTDTADHADLLLPATMQPEHLDVHTAYGHTWVTLNQPAIAAPGQTKPNSEIFRLLARRMGFDEPCFADSDADLIRAALPGIDHVALQRDGRWKLPVPELPFADGGFPTPSGRARVCLPHEADAPDHITPHEDPASHLGAARYPLAMISPPARHFLNSTFANLPSLQAIEREPILELHAEDAAVRGIGERDWVAVFNDRGRLLLRARLNDRARRGVVHGLGIWWKKHSPDGRNVNELTSQALTDIGGGPTFYDCLVEVQRIAAADEPLPVEAIS